MEEEGWAEEDDAAVVWGVERAKEAVGTEEADLVLEVSAEAGSEGAARVVEMEKAEAVLGVVGTEEAGQEAGAMEALAEAALEGEEMEVEVHLEEETVDCKARKTTTVSR